MGACRPLLFLALFNLPPARHVYTITHPVYIILSNHRDVLLVAFSGSFEVIIYNLAFRKLRVTSEALIRSLLAHVRSTSRRDFKPNRPPSCP